jgi:acetyl-CoA synthetase
VIFTPTRAFIEQTNVWRFMQRLGFRDRASFLAWSRDEPERFWDETMREMRVDWFTPYERVLDSSRGPEWAQWFTGGRLNIAHNCLDRWAGSGRTACIWEGENGDTRTVTFADLQRDANRVANGFVSLGLEPGDRVALCLPMVPEVLSILYGCFKAGLTAVPIFSGYGAGAIEARISDCGARAVVTARWVERRGKRIPLADKMPPGIEHTFIIGFGWEEFLREQSPEFDTLSVESEHRALILYTSGTTGRAKGAVHTHAGCLAQTGKEIWLGFDHKADDLFFWLTDIGWMMGPWAIIGNHLFGGTIFLYDGAPDFPTPMRIWDTVERHGVTTFGISPTAIRLLSKDASELPPMGSLRILGSTGEPWDEKAWLWFFERVGRGRCPIVNISGGTEIIGSFLFPLPIQELKPCTLGGPAPGMATEIRDGCLVCTKPAPSMTRGIWNDPERYIETYWSRFPGVWDHGDWVRCDEDGHWFITGRSDESMNVAGRKVGPGEIEAAMMQHPGVAQAAAIGAPDELKGEAIVGFVCANAGAAIDPRAVCATVAGIMGPAFRPREVIVMGELPMTPSGKIIRRQLRETYVG